MTPDREPAADGPAPSDPEADASGREVRSYLESSIESLPDAYRLVFVLREIEGLSTAETADGLQITEDVVKTRLHRARAMLRRDLLSRAGPSISRTFPFLGGRCDRMVEGVMAAIRKLALPGPRPTIQRRIP